MGSRLEAKSTEVRKKIDKHKFEDEQGEEYEPSKFGGFNDYFRRKKMKLQNLDSQIRSSNQGNPPIFRGVVAHVNGYTQPSLNDLHTLIVSHGGGFIQYLDGKTMVTHIIASNLTPKKKVEFARYRIVKPAWVVDSIHAGRLLPWTDYRVVDEGAAQRLLGFENGSVVSQANRSVGGYKDQTDTSWYTSHVKGVTDQLNDDHPGYSSSYGEDSSALGDELTADLDILNEKPKDESAATDEESDFVDVTPVARDRIGSKPSTGDHRDEFMEQSDHLIHAKDSDQDHISYKSDPGPSPISPSERFERHNSDVGAQDPKQIGAKTWEIEDLFPDVLEDEENSKLVVECGATDSYDGEVSDSKLPRPREASSDIKDGEREPRLASKGIEAITPEQHNALLLADPKVWKSTVVNPAFLKQYYEESRLHHLSSWKAALKSQLQALAAEKSSSQRAREKRAPGARRYILHVDFDSFFAAVSLRKQPQYADKPVVVAHGNGAGAEIASCNYPARKFGIKNGMWMKHAQKMCPHLKVLPYDFKAYEEASRSFYTAIIDTGGVVQSVSVDEALVDIGNECIAAGGHDGRGIHEGSIWREQAKADSMAQDLRDKVLSLTGCAVSVGIGGNILLAKVALRKAKPAGQHHVKPEEALDFLGELTMQDLPGIAYSIGGKLEEIGVKFVKDVRALSKERMVSVLGPKTGEKIWDYSRGIDRAEVGDQVIRKSVSAEVNWGIRFATHEQVDEFILSLAQELQKRLLNEGVKGRQLTMKIMRRASDAPLDPPKHLGHGKCDTYNKSLALGVATNEASVIGREALSILKGFGFSPGELRGLGIQMQKLEPLVVNSSKPYDSSQKRLDFIVKKPKKDQIGHFDRDDNDEIETPQKRKEPSSMHPAAAFSGVGSPTDHLRTSLNTSGTQFVLPSQADAEVLKELPDDIRRAILAQGGSRFRNDSPDAASPTRSRSTTPALQHQNIPSHSQLDRDMLDALPAELRSEVLSYYARSSNKSHDQAVLPQSPRKDRAIKLPKKLTTPTKKRGRPPGSLNKPTSAAYSTLTQARFGAQAVASSIAKDAQANASTSLSANSEEIPPDFLSALPEDIRGEVLAQARRDRLQKKGGIDVGTKKKRNPATVAGALAPGQRTLKLGARPPKPSFTKQKFTRLPDLRDAVSAWVQEFQDEKPYSEDIRALITYLRRVIIDECDMDKAISVVRWLRWCVEDDDSQSQRALWVDALKDVEEGVQEALEQRGLGHVDLRQR
ncbi:MAG: deoxycytidyl transferase [Ramalina farinacea]|uniref:DNA repair protein REV1 n=1 Tax=Ramalina farinacea TaxID=258253 RepID=A0AA43QNP2_9LECA|nr:deoxycytidyl transferase [Ramalina farinacea]